MTGNSILDKLWGRISKYGFILAMTLIAMAAYKAPLQQFISLSRYQHVGIAIFLFGMGYVMQTIWSWRVYSKWARISNIVTSAYFCSVGLFFYTNTWLENYVVPTPRNMLVRYGLVFIYLFLALIVSGFWLKWAHEDNKLKDAEKAKKNQSGEKSETVEVVEDKRSPETSN